MKKAIGAVIAIVVLAIGFWSYFNRQHARTLEAADVTPNWQLALPSFDYNSPSDNWRDLITILRADLTAIDKALPTPSPSPTASPSPSPSPTASPSATPTP